MQTQQVQFSFQSILDGSVINHAANEQSYEQWLEQHKQDEVTRARESLSTYSCKHFYQALLDVIPEEFGDFEIIKQGALSSLSKYNGKMQRHDFDSSDICAMLGTLAGAGLVETHEVKHYNGEYCTGNTLTYRRLVKSNYAI